MRLFQKFLKGSKEKEFYACAKILCAIASVDKNISEEEINRVLAGLEFIGFNKEIENIKSDEIGRIWKEAAEIADKLVRMGTVGRLSEAEEIKELLEIKNISSEKRLNLLVAAAKVSQVSGKEWTKELTSDEWGDELERVEILYTVGAALGFEKEQLMQVIIHEEK